METTPERRGALHSTRLGLLVFSTAAAVGFLAAIVPARFAHPQLTMAGAVALGVTIAFAIPVIRRPTLALLACIVILYDTAVALVVLGDYGQSEGLLALLAIPVVASALYGPPALTITAVVAGTGTLVCYAEVNALGLTDSAQLLAVWPMSGIGIAYAIHELRRRLEHTIAIREQAIQHDAVLALIADELYGTFDGDQVIQLGLQSAARLVDQGGSMRSSAAFFLVEDGRATLIATYEPDSNGNGEPDPRIDHLSVPLASISLLRDANSHDGHRLFTINRATVVPPQVGAAIAALGVENAIVQLIRVGGHGVGILAVFNNRTDADGYTPAQQDWLRSFSPLLEIAISRALVFDERTTTDSLTGLVNRREVDRRLSGMPRSSVYSILAIDIDNLKAMNDSFGHPAGDELLQMVAGSLQRSIRRGDTAARVGGDEFCVVLPDAAGQRAEIVATRILRELATRTVHGIRPTVSIGIAGFASGTDATTRLAAADAALYEAKRAGGDRAAHAAAATVHDGTPAA
ncbi:MAG: diguanylate cyclase [Candidatus Dormiibacterota bacterium]